MKRKPVRKQVSLVDVMSKFTPPKPKTSFVKIGKSLNQDQREAYKSCISSFDHVIEEQSDEESEFPEVLQQLHEKFKPLRFTLKERKANSKANLKSIAVSYQNQLYFYDIVNL